MQRSEIFRVLFANILLPFAEHGNVPEPLGHVAREPINLTSARQALCPEGTSEG
jgi:hypothetical protein